MGLQWRGHSASRPHTLHYLCCHTLHSFWDHIIYYKGQNAICLKAFYDCETVLWYNTIHFVPSVLCNPKQHEKGTIPCIIYALPFLRCSATFFIPDSLRWDRGYHLCHPGNLIQNNVFPNMDFHIHPLSIEPAQQPFYWDKVCSLQGMMHRT